MNLIVVESPTKSRTLSRFLGKGFTVEATMGHIKDLPKSTLGVDIENSFKPEYIDVKKKAESVKKIKDKAKNANVIYLATDPDREGEAIAQHVKEVLQNDKIQISNDKLRRIVFHEITKSAVEHAIESPREVDKNLVNAQIARRVLDRLVGYKLSPLLWKKVRRGLSAGRVQSVAVRLIVEREREIEKFKAEEFWEIYVDLEKDKGKTFTVKLLKVNDNKAEVKNKKEADPIVTDLNKSEYKVLDIRRREVRKSPYPPFTTSTLTQTASNFFGWSAKKTMSVAQKLYEQGLITYHRTDSTNIAGAALEGVRKYIEKEFGGNYLPEKPRIFKTKSKVAQEAHEAIRPTHISREFKIRGNKFKREGEILYDIIWKRFIACQMAVSIYDETRIDVEAKPKTNGKKQTIYLLRVSGQVMRFDGWRKVIPASTGSLVGRGGPSKKDEVPQLPEVEKNDPLKKLKVDPQQKFTQPPARFNEASLIKTLEKLGIGRPSTYAPTISTIQIRQYVEKDEGKFTPTPVGSAVNDFLVSNFSSVFDYAFTAELEGNLDKVANGEEKWRDVMSEFWSPFSKKLVSVEEKAKRVQIPTEKLGKKCPTCKKGELVVRVGRFGKFISCSRFPDCEHTERYLEKIGMKCPECGKGDVIVKTTRKGRKFFGCSRYPECKFASWQKPGGNKVDNKK